MIMTVSQPHDSAVPAIRTEALSRRYGDVQAVRDLDLVVPKGSIFGFLGRNGAGKTTTIRLITGLARPDSGRAWINGIETTNGDDRGLNQFGYLPQEPAFYGWMTAEGHLDHAGRLFGLSDAERRERSADLLRLVDLEGAARRKVGGFSGGMKQRLGLAQALIHNPAVLILDEPMAGLDPAGRRDVLDLMETLRSHVTIFFSTHILADVERVCDRVAILHDGRLIEVAERESLLSRYATDVVELVVRAEMEGAPAAFVAELETQAWVSGVTMDENRVRVTAADVDMAQAALLPLIIKHNLTLLRYEWVRPNLEEIFLSLSEVEKS